MGCPFAHAKLPSNFAAIEGLVLEDLGPCNITEQGVFVPHALPDVAELTAKVLGEMAALNGMDGDPAQDQGFGRPPQV